MEQQNGDVRAQNTGPGDGAPGANKQRPASSVGVSLDALNVELDPVSDEEDRLRGKLDGTPEEKADAEEQLELTAGICAFLRYMEDAVPIEDFGPDEGEEDARKDFAILLGRVARKHDFGWLVEYDDEIFCAALGLALYGGPVAQALAPKLVQGYKNLLSTNESGNDGTQRHPNGDDRQTEEREINPASRRAKRRAGDS